jgi:hypothetical protein
MLSGLTFEVPAPAPGVVAERTDIACFIGYVARRPGVALPPAVRDALHAAGWLDGPWAPSGDTIEALEQLPVTCESWDHFANLFAWEQRPLDAAGDATCTTYLGAAVRSFFATGGRHAVIIRVADPFPFLESSGRKANRDTRLRRLVPGIAGCDPPSLPFEPTDPRTWRGIQHLYGLPEVSHVCLPDLPDICAVEPQAAPAAFTPPPAPEVFVECSPDEPPLPSDAGLHRQQAPRCDHEGFVAWHQAVALVKDFLATQRRDVLFLGALPLLQTDASDGGAHAETDLLAFLRGSGVLEPVGYRAPNGTFSSPPGTAASAFIQLAWPWLLTSRSDDLPESIEPADGLLSGLLARNALVRGTFRSVGGTILDEVVGLVPLPAMGLGPDSPTEQLAQRICVFAPEPGGIALASDATTSPDPAWRFGGTSRLMAAILRAARRFGDVHVFDPNGPALWIRLERTLETLLTAFWREGAFMGISTADAFEVRCDASTMSQNDLDSGRLVAVITVRPATAIERITVVLALRAGSPGATAVREVA